MNQQGTNAPFMYIEQPELQVPTINMQSEFHSSTDVHSEKEEVAEQSETDELNTFKKLSIKEKISYLMNLPEEIPAIHCEVASATDTHEGIMIEADDQEVTLRVYGEAYQTFKIKDIETIRLLGF